MNRPYVPIEELAKHLSVSVSTVRGWVRKKNIPENTYIRVGNTYRFSMADVVDALSAVKEQPVDVADLSEPDEDL
jgi:excisionase family DNA binding protein|tara:strand:- start:2951 stop:3175 length:225 start_codon:yes stop_codon:yes gene_type:complete